MKSKPETLIFILAFTVSFLILLTLNACRTAEPAVVAPEPAAVTPVTPKPIVESPPPEPLLIDWPGTTWLLSEMNQTQSENENFPGYRALYFGRDGFLFLINMDNAEGGRWNADGSKLVLSMQKNDSNIELAGEFLVGKDSSDSSGFSGSAVRALLTSTSADESFVLTKTEPNVNMIENRWVPRKLEGEKNVRWPIDRETSFIILPNAEGTLNILGFIGDTRFQGFFSLGKETFTTGELVIVQKSAPPSHFETLYKNQLRRANRYVQVKNDLFLFMNTRPIASFRVGMFN